MEISRNLNCKQNKQEIDRLERKLDKLKLIANETDEIGAQIKQLEGLIKNYFNKKTEAAKIRSRVKWAEEGEKQQELPSLIARNVGLRRPLDPSPKFFDCT
jgi:hypothetical protein